MKPVASGACPGPAGLLNDDAQVLSRMSGVPAPYHLVNPFVFEPAIAPHLAASEAGIPIDFDTIARAARELAVGADFLLVEGVGGWLVPLDGCLDVADLALRLGYPVVLVVGLRLGCINHALLSAESIKGRGAHLAGWVGSCLQPDMPRLTENLATLRAALPAPCLGVLPHRPDGDFQALAAALDPGPLL
jgi:dethiobiotin synthetase